MDVWLTIFLSVTTLMAATGISLILVGYLQVIPAAISKAWSWFAIVLLLPIVGGVWFSLRHWSECSKIGKQLIAGAILMLVATALLYGAGPHFVARLAVAVKGGA